GSIMTHAENYKGKLLLVHGTMDDNVHVQNTIQLVDKFIDLNKDFEMMLYPGERHGWRSQKRFHSTREANQFWFKYFLNREIP
ncbi:MAG: S9 family peptidase, partial [Melioribacteraceae bacterium]|nr:S9 family peptidase [Melioribacteraceae bacterium]